MTWAELMNKRSHSWLTKFSNCRIAWKCAGLAFASVLLFSGLLNDCAGPEFASPPFMASNSTVPGTGVPWYFRSGQWRADMRSLAEVLRYLAESQKIAQTNPVPAKADNA